MANEELLNQEEPLILELTDEEGNEIALEVLDSVDYEGVEYLVLLPDEEGADEVVILEVEPQTDGSESFLTVDNEDILNAVFEIFQARVKEFFPEEA